MIIYNTNQEFVKKFSVALLSYLDDRNPRGAAMHIIDHATEASSFAEAFFYTLDGVIGASGE